MSENTIYSVNGPVVKIQNAVDFSMPEKVYISRKRLMGEVISISREATTIQMYESTIGLKLGEPVEPTGNPISVTLGPGILRNVFNGIECPLKEIARESGAFIATGSDVALLSEEVLWDVTVKVSVGDEVIPGQTFTTFPETDLVEHRCMIPPALYGTVVGTTKNGTYGINQCILKVKDEKDKLYELALVQRWPIKMTCPVTERLPISVPLITGQRIFDTLFPIAKGGTAAIPGGFGTGETMTQHQLARRYDANIIVYVGCGKYGSETTQALEEFPELIDPKSNRPLTDRTVLITNTSNMSVAACEADIYTDLTLAEYYRGMGYHAAIVADSTSCWAEAPHEISGRLEEMPVEEGFPAYLLSHISQSYERVGYMKTLNDQVGSVSIIGTVSPQGSNFSKPVTQNTKRFVCCFWALDKQLACARHYFATSWAENYSEYVTDLTKWYNKDVDTRFLCSRREVMSLLAEGAKLMEIIKLIGDDVLPKGQKLVIEICKVIQVGYLQQNVSHRDDTYVPLREQMKAMDAILYSYKKCRDLVAQGEPMSQVVTSGIFDKVIKMKYDVSNDHIKLLGDYFRQIDMAVSQVA